MRLVQAIQFHAKYREVRMVGRHISRARVMPEPMLKSVGHPCGARVWEVSFFIQPCHAAQLPLQHPQQSADHVPIAKLEQVQTAHLCSACCCCHTHI